MDQFEEAHSRWRIKTVDFISATDGIAIGPFGSKMKSDCYVDDGVPVIRGSNVDAGRHFKGDFVYITEEKADELSSSNVFANDLVFPHRGSIGEVGLVPDSRERWMLSTSLMKFTPNTELISPLFAYYYFKSPWGKRELLKNASTVGTPGIGTPLTSLRSVRVPLPPLPVQRRIADILGALDDKIELNRRMNRTLEDMAQTLYRHWFVDFGPFQDQPFVDSELGPIPEGWEVKPFLNTCDIETGGTPKTSIDEYWGGPIQWASAKDVSQNNNPILLDTERTVTQSGVDNSSTDILPAGTTAIVARGATTGRHTILGVDMALNQTCYGLVGKDHHSWGWTYLAVGSQVKRLQKRAYGSAFDSVTISTFKNLDIVDAPEPVVRDFNDKVMPLFEQMRTNVQENRSLAKARDYLLPKLISGEISVDAAEEKAKAAA